MKQARDEENSHAQNCARAPRFAEKPGRNVALPRGCGRHEFAILVRMRPCGEQ